MYLIFCWSGKAELVSGHLPAVPSTWMELRGAICPVVLIRLNCSHSLQSPCQGVWACLAKSDLNPELGSSFTPFLSFLWQAGALGEGKVFSSSQLVSCLLKPLVTPCITWCAGATTNLPLLQDMSMPGLTAVFGDSWRQRVRRSWEAREGTLVYLLQLRWWTLFVLCFGLIWGSCSLLSSWLPIETACGVGRDTLRQHLLPLPRQASEHTAQGWEKTTCSTPWSFPRFTPCHPTINISITQSGFIFSLPLPLPPCHGREVFLPR